MMLSRHEVFGAFFLGSVYLQVWLALRGRSLNWDVCMAKCVSDVLVKLKLFRGKVLDHSHQD